MNAAMKEVDAGRDRATASVDVDKLLTREEKEQEEKEEEEEEQRVLHCVCPPPPFPLPPRSPEIPSAKGGGNRTRRRSLRRRIRQHVRSTGSGCRGWDWVPDMQLGCGFKFICDRSPDEFGKTILNERKYIDKGDLVDLSFKGSRSGLALLASVSFTCSSRGLKSRRNGI